MPVSGRSTNVLVWPGTGLLILVGLIAAAWRYRSWLMGVFENVDVLGRSGADLENELLHTFEAPDDAPPVEPEAPVPDPRASPPAEAGEGKAQPSQES